MSPKTFIGSLIPAGTFFLAMVSTRLQTKSQQAEDCFIKVRGKEKCGSGSISGTATHYCEQRELRGKARQGQGSWETWLFQSEIQKPSSVSGSACFDFRMPRMVEIPGYHNLNQENRGGITKILNLFCSVISIVRAYIAAVGNFWIWGLGFSCLETCPLVPLHL